MKLLEFKQKKYSMENKVTNIDVQKLIGALSFKNYKATKGILITTSLFTKMAYEQAESNPIELWDINRLKKEIENIIVR